MPVLAVEFQAVHHDVGIAVETNQRRRPGGEVESVERIVAGGAEVNSVVERIEGQLRGCTRVSADGADKGLGAGGHVDRVQGAVRIDGDEIGADAASDKGGNEQQEDKDNFEGHSAVRAHVQFLPSPDPSGQD